MLKKPRLKKLPKVRYTASFLYPDNSKLFACSYAVFWTWARETLLLLLLFFFRLLVYATADEAVAYMFYRCFFVFFRPQKNMRQPFSGTAERIFMKLLPNDTGENGVCNVVPPPGE